MLSTASIVTGAATRTPTVGWPDRTLFPVHRPMLPRQFENQRKLIWVGNGRCPRDLTRRSLCEAPKVDYQPSSRGLSLIPQTFDPQYLVPARLPTSASARVSTPPSRTPVSDSYRGRRSYLGRYGPKEPFHWDDDHGFSRDQEGNPIHFDGNGDAFVILCSACMRNNRACICRQRS
jgi:hypothetical protein